MKLKHFSRQLFDFDSHYPRTIIAMVVFLTVVFCWKIFNLEMDPSVRSNLPTDHEIVKSMEKINELFSGSDIIIVAVESDSLFSKGTLKTLSTFHDSLESIEIIGKVLSIQSDNKDLEEANIGDKVAVKFENPHKKSIGRHFEENNEIISLLTRKRIDILKDHFRSILTKKDWLLVRDLKNKLKIK